MPDTYRNQVSKGFATSKFCMDESTTWRTDKHGNRFHATALIGEDTRFGSRNVVGPFSVIGGLGCSVRIGDDNSFGVGCVIGSPAESASGYPGSAHLDFEEWSKSNPKVVKGVIVGSKCVIRDRVTVHAGIDESTLIGDLNYVHSNCHIDHDYRSGTGVVLAPNVVVGGRVTLRDFCQIGLGACVHQGSLVGELAMVGMNSTVKGAVRPLTLVFGSPARYQGLNRVRLQRLGVDENVITGIETILEKSSLSTNEQTQLKSIIEELVRRSFNHASHAW